MVKLWQGWVAGGKVQLFTTSKLSCHLFRFSKPITFPYCLKINLQFTTEFISVFLTPLLPRPPCQQGSCTAPDTCSCHRGFGGRDCSKCKCKKYLQPVPAQLPPQPALLEGGAPPAPNAAPATTVLPVILSRGPVPALQVHEIGTCVVTKQRFIQG